MKIKHCINTHLGLNSKILIANYSNEDYKLMNIDDVFKKCKKKDMTLIYNSKLENEEQSSQKGIIAKILKLDKNSQYEYAMTKPMSVSSFQLNRNLPTMKAFNILLETVKRKEQKNPDQKIYVSTSRSKLAWKNKSDIVAYKATKKTHAILLEDPFIPLLLERI